MKKSINTDRLYDVIGIKKKNIDTLFKINKCLNIITNYKLMFSFVDHINVLFFSTLGYKVMKLKETELG